MPRLYETDHTMFQEAWDKMCDSFSRSTIYYNKEKVMSSKAKKVISDYIDRDDFTVSLKFVKGELKLNTNDVKVAEFLAGAFGTNFVRVW